MPTLAEANRQRRGKTLRTDVKVDNTTASQIVEQLSGSLVNAFQMIAKIMQDQNAMLERVLERTGNNDDVLAAIKAQNEKIEALAQRPVQVESSTQLEGRPRLDRLELEMANGQPVALVPVYEDES